MTRKLNKREAIEFASMVLSGAPAAEVVRYFWDVEMPEEVLLACEEEWPIQAEVLESLQKQMGGQPWHHLGDDERLDVSLRKHYNEMAYFLWTTNYAECDGSSKIKADTCRQAIEAKVAGMSGKESPLASFYHDLLQRYEQQGKAN
tara:strand:+ start:830 stop:1267 length:438 start_codon:yes stop_codon:yes gene_type:complete